MSESWGYGAALPDHRQVRTLILTLILTPTLTTFAQVHQEANPDPNPYPNPNPNPDPDPNPNPTSKWLNPPANLPAASSPVWARVASDRRDLRKYFDDKYGEWV